MAYVIGVDVGGTNTDAVVLAGSTVIASAKRPTSQDKTSGVHGRHSSSTGEPLGAEESGGGGQHGSSQHRNNTLCERCLGEGQVVHSYI